MRNILLRIAVAMLPATFASAEPSKHPKLARPSASGRPLPTRGAGAGNSCAAYGPGFVRIEGTATCMKIGGAISIGVGGSSGSR
jgi:hypothetical protein